MVPGLRRWPRATKIRVHPAWIRRWSWEVEAQEVDPVRGSEQRRCPARRSSIEADSGGVAGAAGTGRAVEDQAAADEGAEEEVEGVAVPPRVAEEGVGGAGRGRVEVQRAAAGGHDARQLLFD